MSIKFEKGDIIAFSYKSVLGKLIRFMTFGIVNHVAIVVDEHNCIEARGSTNKIEITPINEVLERNSKIYLCKLKPEYRQLLEHNSFRFNEAVKHYQNTKYGWLSAIKAWIDTYFKFIPFRNTKRLCCSALVAYIYYNCRFLLDQKPTEYTPDEIFDMKVFETRQIIKEK